MNIKAGRRALLASTCIGSFFACSPLAIAQDAPNPSQEAPASPEAANLQSAESQCRDASGADQCASPKQKEIIVTGSRIRQSNFNTSAPLQIVTRDDRILAGARSTADVLQGATVTSGTSQINGAFLGFVSEGGPAANTVGLRGLGSQRTLVLLNGRRLQPSGSGSQLVSADLNVLPTTIVKQYQILREGNSSLYGSDAIAGVINIITDDAIEGVTLDGYVAQPTGYGAGGDRRVSIAAGHVFDRGHITASFEFHDQRGLKVKDRKAFSCPRDLLFDPTTGKEVGSIDPATGQLSCFPYALGSGAGTASGYAIAQSFSGLPVSRLTYDNGDINTLRAVNGLNRVSPSPMQLQDTVISPIRTYTGYLNGSYQLDILGDAEIYGEALFTRRESHQDSIYQLNIDQTQLSPRVELYGGSYEGTPLSEYGYPTSPFFPNSLANAGYNFATPLIIPDKTNRSSQRSDFWRANAGLKGNTGIGDWRYDANFQYSQTRARYSLVQITTDRLSNALSTVLAPAGTPANLITTALPGQAGAGNAYTCASNVANGALIAGANCVPLNMFDPSILIGGHMPANVYNYLFSTVTGHTGYNEQIATLNLDGTVFDLPAGPLRAALGYEWRRDHINDVPSIEAQNGTLYNYSSAGITRGTDIVNEVYGEIQVPVFKDRPFAKDLNFNASARYTHYRSYGSDVTYSFRGTWAPVDLIRFRANYGTSFRAPNLYEQFVADQSGFYSGGVDPCSLFSTTYAVGSTEYNNCLAALTPILGANAVNFVANAGPQVVTKGGHGLLKAETSNSWGFGAILTLPPTVADFSFSVDYWNISVKDEVSVLNNLVLNRCYEATDFPNNQYCALIAPRRPVGDPYAGALSSFDNPYLNVASQKASGIDFDLRYQQNIAGGVGLLRVQATRNLHQIFQLFAEDAPVDYNGTLGEQGAGAGPKWVGQADLDYTLPSGKVKVHYGLRYVGKQDSTESIGAYVAGLGLGAVNTDFVAEEYFEHELSIQFKIEDLGQITFGIQNLTDSHPPLVSQIPASNGLYTRIGNYFNSSNYDLYGRTAYINVTKTFK